MKAEIYAHENKQGEVTFNPFEYTYSGNITEVREFLEKMKKQNGPNIRTGESIVAENGVEEIVEISVEGEKEQAKHIDGVLNVLYGLRVKIVQK